MGWVITAWGHSGITAKHRTTLMLTKDREVGPKGDCVIAVGADRATSDLDPELKRAIRSGCELVLTLKAKGVVEKIRARGHPSLTLNHPTDLVIRKSRFIDGRTLAFEADKAAADLSRKFVEILQDPKTELEMKIEVNAQRSSSGSIWGIPFTIGYRRPHPTQTSSFPLSSTSRLQTGHTRIFSSSGLTVFFGIESLTQYL